MQQMLNSALLVAAVAHDGQFDKAGKPYLLHVLRVFQNLESDDEELNCIGVLHDVIEDTDTTYAQLREIGMSERVIDAVKLLTKVRGQTADEYLDGILTSVDAMLVKLADLTDNMDLRRLKGVTDKDMKRMNKYVLMYHAIDNELKNQGFYRRWDDFE
ncbi:putative metal-dependent phosphohydrolase [Sinorhizobium phage phiM12]|uniref:Putative metal-dependent phosphohydrolase n=1 Tax=Sinorhizobium phage phiM12 TaxID=1357423 RepID=S5MBX1_9CAUD|nr:metal-dependent phosphohydrolase [Sinorhizobium phage phiM12]AGR48128.1 putative metal-dependent phosphohydrolase [Sinorhizobium phage phiM12]